MRNYNEHELKIIDFGDSDVFTRLVIDPSADEEGGGASQHSYGGDNSSDM